MPPYRNAAPTSPVGEPGRRQALRELAAGCGQETVEYELAVELACFLLVSLGEWQVLVTAGRPAVHLRRSSV
ncbi:hypothetical protein SALBM135S_05600 [Streptomyces alboniger]